MCNGSCHCGKQKEQPSFDELLTAPSIDNKEHGEGHTPRHARKQKESIFTNPLLQAAGLVFLFTTACLFVIAVTV